MKASGLFFLSMHATIASDMQGTRVLLLPVVERDAQDHRIVLNRMTVKWCGDDALAFYDTHQAELRAGRPLQLELDRLYGRDGEWKARATRCELAPVAPSWRAKDEPQPQAHPA